MQAKNLKAALASFLSGLVFCLSFTVSANHDVNQAQGIMIDGYDVVAYHTMGQAMTGSKEFSTEWLGAKWLFANAIHRDLFIADPVSYLPQYGGYCALSYEHGKEHGRVDPTAWQIVDGKLYLFYGSKGVDRWDFNRSRVQEANRKWEKAKSGLLQQ